MSRLFLCMVFTSGIEEMKSFYRDAVGLNPVTDGPNFVQFEGEPDGASLGLLAVASTQKREIELCFETPDLLADVAVLRGRGIRFIDEIRKESFGKVIHFRDPEGNLFSLLEPDASVAGSSANVAARGSTSREDGGGRTAVAVGASPVLAHAIVNTRDLSATKAFFREKLGFRFRTETPDWVEFETGAVALVVRPLIEVEDRERQGVTLGFAVGDVIAWHDQASDHVPFTSAPGDESWGESADAVDPDGNEITFLEPPAPASLEEQLAEEFEAADTPQVSGFRKTVKKGAKAVTRVVMHPEPESEAPPKKAGRKTAPKPASRATTPARDAAPARRPPATKPKAAPKRAKQRPATGRLKKAERRTLGTKKQDVARASKSKPVKRAVSRQAKKR